MSATNKDQLLFDRLRAQDTNAPIPWERLLKDDPGGLMPYLGQDGPLQTQTEMVSADYYARAGRFASFREALMGRLDFALAKIPQSSEVEKLRAGFSSADPRKTEATMSALARYLDSHPAFEIDEPILAMFKEFPPGFFFALRASGTKTAGLEKAAKNYGIHIGLYRDFMCSERIQASMQLALGNLFPPKFIQAFGETRPGDTDEEMKSERQFNVPALVRMFKAAEKVYGAEWAKTDPDGLRLMRKDIARLEWEESNPVLESENQRASLAGMKKLNKSLARVAAENGGSGVRMSWPFLIKKLWENEELLKQQYMGVPLENYGVDIESDKVSTNIDDPRFKPALVEIGRRFAPFIEKALVEKPSGEKINIYDSNLKMTLEGLGKIFAEQKISAQEGMDESSGFEFLGRQLLEKYGWPDEPGLRALCQETIRKNQWDEVLGFKDILKAAVEAPDLFGRACKLEEGFFRDFFLSEAWKREPKKTRQLAEKYLSHMQKEVPDGAKANRAADIMNAYVQNNIWTCGTRDPELRKVVMERWISLQAPEDQDEIRRQYPDGPPGYGTFNIGRSHYDHYRFGLECDEELARRKKEISEKWRTENTPSVRDLHLFSDAVSRQESREAMLEKSYSVRLVTAFANAELSLLRGQLLKPESPPTNPEKLRLWVLKYLPEPCLLRDFYLESAFNLKLWNHLKASRLGPRLEAEGITLSVVDVDLNDHFEGRDDGVLQDAYFTRYPLFRVQGLAAKTSLFTPQEQAGLADLLHGASLESTPAAAEGYDRMAIELEAERIKSSYQETYADNLPRGRSATVAEEQAARDKSFETVFNYIARKFPLASYNRDELLERFAIDCATTPEHARRVEEAAYTFLVRRPDVEKQNKEKVIFAPVETVKNYLALFRDRESRLKALTWIFNGELTDDRYTEGSVFGVNADDEREMFWAMSNAERKAVLYNALMGDNGLFEVPSKIAGSQDDRARLMDEFLKSFYANNFRSMIKPESEDSAMEPVLNTVFMSVFRYYSVPRRVELLLSITNKMRELRLNKKELSVGQAVRLFLEQVGVVGIKAGQVLSESRGLVNEEIKQELSSLRDRAAPFSKSGVFSYLRTAGLLVGSRPAESAQFQISEVGECLGSASIKQAHRAWTVDRKPLVVKVPRPTIDKNYEEDVAVLEKTLADLRAKGTNVPEFLLREIVDACATEFDFGQEGSAQREMDQKLFARRASVEMPEGEAIRLDVPDLAFLLRKGESRVRNLQLMVDEYVGGLNLAELEEFQKLSEEPPVEPEKQARLRNQKTKIHDIYKDRAAFAERAYAGFPAESVRAQIALDLMEQIMVDGVFHSDLHSGNIILDVEPNAQRVALIDFGSVGRSAEVLPDGVRDHRPAFRDFLKSLLLLKTGQSDARELGEIVNKFVEVPGFTAESWAERIQAMMEKNEEFAGFFKELLADMLAQKAKMDRQFKFLLKALAAAGGHFDALSMTIVKAVGDSFDQPEGQKKSVGEILLGYPGMKRLIPILETMPELKRMLGL